ncbi:hypothetical protein FG91_03202 [Sphingopyxis sp. LC81]|nr:hypothetical protein FG91_03202 [Sphingopyxis sp. LC81]
MARRAGAVAPALVMVAARPTTPVAARRQRTLAVRAPARMGGTATARDAAPSDDQRRRCVGAARPADRRRRRAAAGAAGLCARDRRDLCPARSQGCAADARCRGRDGHRQDARLPCPRETMDRPVGGRCLHLDLHQGAAAPIVARDRAPLPRRRDAPRKGRGAQGARKLPLPAQSRRRVAGRLFGPRRDPRAACGALGRLYTRRRHGRRRPARLAPCPVSPQRNDGAHRPAWRVHLCGLPAFQEVFHRTFGARRDASRDRHRQPCADDGAGGAPARRRRPRDAAYLRRRASSVGRGGLDVRRSADGAGSRRDSPLGARPRGQVARAAARARGAARRCRKL